MYSLLVTRTGECGGTRRWVILTWEMLIVWKLGWIGYHKLMEDGFGSSMFSQRFNFSCGNVPIIVLKSMTVLLPGEWTPIHFVLFAVRSLKLSSMPFGISRRLGLYGTSWEQWVLTETSFPQMLKIGWWLMRNRTQPTIRIPLRGKSYSLLPCGIFGRIWIILFLRGGHRIQV